MAKRYLLYPVGGLLFLTFTIPYITSAQPVDETPLFSTTPIWTSGTTYGGGDGNAQWLDVDRDGDPDLVTSIPSPRRWVLFKNEKGKLAPKPSWESKETTDCDHISVLDFDQDGWADLAATHESHCTIYLNSAGKKKNRFNDLPDWETSFYTDANQIDFGDFDKDGDLDMLMASGLPVYGLALFENQNDTISRTVSRTLGPRAYSESSIFADIDSDDDLDIIATYSKKGTIIIFDNDGSGKYDEGTLVYLDEEVRHVQRVYCIDIDEDGVKEIFCAKGPWGPPGASVGLGQQPGSKAMKVIWRSGAETGYHGFDFRDVDQDGDLDMAAADWPGRTVSIYLQEQGKLSESPAWTAKTGGYAHEVDFADVDGDGDFDLAVGCRDQALVFENLSEMPKAREVLQRAIEAVGGDQTLERLKAQTMWMERGTYYVMGHGTSYIAQYASKWPDWYRQQIEGVLVTTVSGDKAWLSGEGKIEELEGSYLSARLNEVRTAWAQRLFPLKDKTYELVEIEGEQVNGQETIGIKAIHADDGDIKLFFDKETYLLAKLVTIDMTPEHGSKPVTREVVFLEHGHFGGVLMPSKYKIYYDKKISFEAEVIDYKMFATLDPEQFEPPE